MIKFCLERLLHGDIKLYVSMPLLGTKLKSELSRKMWLHYIELTVMASCLATCNCHLESQKNGYEEVWHHPEPYKCHGFRPCVRDPETE